MSLHVVLLFSFTLFAVTNRGQIKRKKVFPHSVREQMTPQAISIVTMAANITDGVSINAAEYSNWFWRKINAYLPECSLQMLKQAGLSAEVFHSADSH